jgi:hypothetical protein
MHNLRPMFSLLLLTAFTLLNAGCAAPSASPPSPVTLPPVVTQLTVNVKTNCGAKGDARTNDTAAFQKAAAIIQNAGGGTLIIPPGTYIIGLQLHEPGQYPFYKPQPMFHVSDINGLLIEGHNAILRTAPGLHFGSFDKDTGAIFNPKMPFMDRAYRVDIGRMIDVTKSRNIVIRNLQLDGNVSNLIIGGTWGDLGRQVEAYGISVYNDSNVHLDHIYSHHHALDGAIIGWSGLKETDPPTPYTLTDCAFEYNARQALSWVGGRGITARRCKFNHTQRGLNNGIPLASVPGCGLDIEAEDSVCRDGHFEDCQFLDNGGPGIAADQGDGGYTRFAHCAFWGTTSWSVWSNRPALAYEDCTFYGSAVHAVGSANPALATTWTRCTFEDKRTNGDGKAYGKFLLELNGDLPNVRLDACVFTANTRKSIWCAGNGVTFTDCTITHRWPAPPPGDFQCLIRGGTLSGCHFMESFPPETSTSWCIITDGTHIAPAKPTLVDGPHIHWGSPTGPVGQIPPMPPAQKTGS